MKNRTNAINMRPARAIARKVNGNFYRLKNAMHGVVIVATLPRHTSIARMLGALPRPALEAILQNLSRA